MALVKAIPPHIVAAATVLLFLGACRPHQEEPPAAEPPADSGNTGEAAPASGGEPSVRTKVTPAAAAADAETDAEPVPPESAPIAYESTLPFEDLAFRVTAHGEGARKRLVVQAIQSGTPVGNPAMAPIDGDVIGAYAADLDGDRNPEILVVSRSRKEGRAASLTGLAYIGGQFSPLTVPDLDASQAGGYRGGDTFNVSKSRIVRKFPVYEGDGDQPTGKVRTITYALEPGLALAVEGTDG